MVDWAGGFVDNFKLAETAINAYVAIINNQLIEDPQNPQNHDYMDYVKDFILNFNVGEFEHEIYDSTITDYHDYNISEYERARELSFGMNLFSFMCDMSYYHLNANERQTILSKLDSLITFSIDLLENPNWNLPYWCYNAGFGMPNYLFPQIRCQTYRTIFLCGIGYACIVYGEELEQGTRLNDFVMQQFWSDTPYPPGTDLYGLTDWIVTNSGRYVSGLSYQNRTMDMASLFFTAINRVLDFNFWDTEFVTDLINQTVVRIDPQYKHFTQEDDFRDDISGNANKQIERGLLPFFYQNSNDLDCRKSIRWYVHRLKENNPSGKYPKELGNDLGSSFITVICYNPASPTNLPIDNEQGYFPDYLEQGNYSNEELSILRPEINSNNDFVNSPSLIVNHENSLEFSHGNDEKTSIQLFYKEKYFIVDLGYRTWYNGDWGRTMEWFQSSYAQNVIIINPDSTEEYYDPDANNRRWVGEYLDLEEWCRYSGQTPLVNLNKKDPKSTNRVGFNMSRVLYNYQSSADLPNPAQKYYLISSDNLSALKIGVRYDNNTSNHISQPDSTNLHPCDVYRNLYMIDDGYYVMYDEVINTENYFNDYRNQLHLNPYSLDSQDETYPNMFCTSIDNVKLYGIMGAVNDFNTFFDNKNENQGFGFYRNGLPCGWTGSKSLNHSRMRITSNGVDEKFITILYPTESSNNPITDIVDGDSYYAVEIYDAAKTPTEKSYYAVSDSLLYISFNDIDINSDAAFVGLTYRPGYQFATKVTQFVMSDGDILFYNDNDTLLIDPNSSIEEVIASYSGTELSVIVKSDDEYPKYRILRQGVDPDNFSSIGVANKENGTSNIKHLSYDSDYFYVNWYDFSSGSVNLITPILVPYGDTLVIGNGVTINCMNSDIKIEIEGEISIGDSVTFTSPDFVYWDGIYMNNSLSELEIEYLKLDRGILYNQIEELDISHSEFNSSGIYQAGITLAVSYTDFDSSNVECEWTHESTDSLRVDISDCNFENYSDSVLYAIEVAGYSRYSITDNEISDCSGGINVNESGSVALCDISDNTITNNDGNGIVLYHSYGEITGHNDIEENIIGIVSTHNSPLKVLGSESTPYQTVKNNAYEEVKFDIDSAPLEEEEIQFAFNRITDESCAGGNDQYLINCIKFEGDARDIIVQYNYWHPTSPEWEEWDGDELFYPDSAFDYIPTWEPKKNGNPSPAGILYNNAEALIKQGKYEDAKTAYKSIINQYPTTEYAIYSIRNLLSVETIYGRNFSSLKQYYLTDQNCNLDYKRTKLSKYLANYCSIKMEDYATAITFFEDIISDPDTELDSVYAVIDAGYTYLLMENSGKSYKGRMTELIPKSRRDFKQKRMALLSHLLEIPETISGISTEDYMFSLHQNFPNPFGNSTIISFTLPKNTQKANLKIYNIRGQLVRKLDINTKSGLGNITWDGRDSSGKVTRNGVYFYKLTADKKETIKKMVLIR